MLSGPHQFLTWKFTSGSYRDAVILADATNTSRMFALDREKKKKKQFTETARVIMMELVLLVYSPADLQSIAHI